MLFRMNGRSIDVIKNNLLNKKGRYWKVTCHCWDCLLACLWKIVLWLVDC